jgi:uncharacterized protein (TIGR02246 family)
VNSNEEQIRQLVATWMEETKAGDIDAVLDLMADDVVFLVAGQPPMIGKAAYAAAAKGQPGAARPEFDGRSEIQEVSVHGDVAYMWTKLTVVVSPPGGAAKITRAGQTLSVLKKQAGRWVLARDANLLVRVN